MAEDGELELGKSSSAACTRSGAFALAVSLLLLLIIPYWQKLPNYDALRSYIGARFNLADAVDELNNSPLWQRYIDTHDDGDELAISSLFNLNVPVSTSEPPLAKEQSRKTQKTKSRKGPATHQIAPASYDAKTALKSGAPAPPTGLGVSTSESRSAHAYTNRKVIGPPSKPQERSKHMPLRAPTNLAVVVTESLRAGKSISEELEILNDPKIQYRAEQVSNYFQFSIVKWLNRRNAMVYANVLKNNCASSELELRQRSPGVSVLAPEALWKCLTVADVKKLASFELPSMSNTLELGGRVEPFIDVSFGTLPREPLLATLVALLLLSFALAYFGAFVSEAVSLTSFPIPGTLFGVFARTWWARGVFLVMLLFPLVSSVGVAIVSRKLSIVLTSPVVFIAEAPTLFYLFRAGYFGQLKRRSLNDNVEHL